MMHRIKKFARTCLAIVALISSAQVLAETERVVYVNGIMTKPIDAEYTAQNIKAILDQSVNHTATKKTFVVTKSYNPMGWSTAGDGCLDGTGVGPASDPAYCLHQDNVELAMLKAAEERYLLSLQQLAMPHDEPKPLDVASATTIAQYADLMYGATADNTGLVKYGVADSSGMYATQLAISGLSYAIQPTSVQSDGSIVSGPVIVVAHSQGNLLANIAYAKSAIDYPQDNLGDDISKRVRIVNLGNTSQVSMHNLSLTNSGDGALFGADENYGTGLYNLAQTYALAECLEEGPLCNVLTSKNTWYRTTPSCNNDACLFTLDVATFGFPNGVSGKSIANHSVDTMYLSDNTVDPIDTRGVSYTSGATRFRDRFEDLVYTASSSLDKSSTVTLAPVLWDEFRDYSSLTSTWGWTSGLVQGIYSNEYLSLSYSGTSPSGLHSVIPMAPLWVAELDASLRLTQTGANTFAFRFGTLNGTVVVVFPNDTSTVLAPDGTDCTNKIRIAYTAGNARCEFSTGIDVSLFRNSLTPVKITFDAQQGIIKLDQVVSGGGAVQFSVAPQFIGKVTSVDMQTRGPNVRTVTGAQILFDYYRLSGIPAQ